MRRDMNKVLTERPRAGGEYIRRKKTARKYRPVDLDDENDVGDGIKRLPSSRKRVYGSGSKHLTDLIGPLKRYLHSKIGSHWDDVWSEACNTLDRRSTSGNHVFEHLVNMVSTRTFMWGGKVHEYWDGAGTPKPVDGLYVHPVTGVLCFAKPKRKKYVPYSDPNMLDGPSDVEWFTRIEGIWFLSTYVCHRAAPAFFGYFPERKDNYHEFTRVRPETWDERKIIGGRAYFYRRTSRLVYFVRVSKRQLSKRELMRLGLANNGTPDKRNRRELNKLMGGSHGAR